MVNFNVNPNQTNNTPKINKSEYAINWSHMIYGYYNSDGYPITGYSSLYNGKNGKQIIISQTTYDTTLGYYTEPTDSTMVYPFYHTFAEKNLGIAPIVLIDIPSGLLCQYAIWNNKPRTWLFSDVLRHVILVIGPIGVSADPSYENSEVTTKLTFSEEFILLNDPDLLSPNTNTTHTNNSITSNGGYAILYFPQMINMLTIESTHLESYVDNTYTYIDIGSSIQFGLINNLSIFGLDTNVRKSKQVTLNIDNNTHNHELITNPLPFEIPEFNYHDYNSRKLVKFNIFEKE